MDQDLATLDTEYNTLSDHMARGEQDEFNPEWFGNLLAFQFIPDDLIWFENLLGLKVLIQLLLIHTL